METKTNLLFEVGVWHNFLIKESQVIFYDKEPTPETKFELYIYILHFFNKGLQISMSIEDSKSCVSSLLLSTKGWAKENDILNKLPYDFQIFLIDRFRVYNKEFELFNSSMKPPQNAIRNLYDTPLQEELKEVKYSLLLGEFDKINRWTLRHLEFWALVNQVTSEIKNTIMKTIPKSASMDSNIFYNIGVEQCNNEDWTGAIENFDIALDIDPTDSIVYIERGVAKAALNDFSGAISDYNKSIKIDPKNSNAYANRAIAKAGLQDQSGAISDLTLAIEVDPLNADAQYIRGRLNIMYGNRSRGISDLWKAADLGSTSAKSELEKYKP